MACTCRYYNFCWHMLSYCPFGIFEWQIRNCKTLQEMLAKGIYKTDILICYVTTLSPEQNGRHFAEGILNPLLILIEIQVSSWCRNENDLAFFQAMAWCWTGDKPSPEPMMTQFTDAYIRHWASACWPLHAFWLLHCDLVTAYGVITLDHNCFG